MTHLTSTQHEQMHTQTQNSTFGKSTPQLNKWPLQHSPLFTHRSIYFPLQLETPQKKKQSDCISKTSTLKLHHIKGYSIQSDALSLRVTSAALWSVLFHRIPPLICNTRHERDTGRELILRLLSRCPICGLLGSRRKLMTNMSVFMSCLFCSIPKTLQQLPSKSRKKEKPSSASHTTTEAFQSLRRPAQPLLHTPLQM